MNFIFLGLSFSCLILTCLMSSINQDYGEGKKAILFGFLTVVFLCLTFIFAGIFCETIK